MAKAERTAETKQKLFILHAIIHFFFHSLRECLLCFCLTGSSTQRKVRHVKLSSRPECSVTNCVPFGSVGGWLIRLSTLLSFYSVTRVAESSFDGHVHVRSARWVAEWAVRKYYGCKWILWLGLGLFQQILAVRGALVINYSFPGE